MMRDFTILSKTNRENFRLNDDFNIKNNNIIDENNIFHRKKRLSFGLLKVY